MAGGRRRAAASILAVVALVASLLGLAAPAQDAAAAQPLAARDGVQEIQALYVRLGGEAGPMGPATSGVIPIAGPTGSGLGIAYAGGSIYWTESYGAASVTGDALRRYFEAGGAAGAMGWPLAEASTSPAGTAQAFERASVYQSTGSSAIVVRGSILQRYHALGGSAGGLGWPTSAEIATGDGLGQVFQGGSIFASALGAFSVVGGVRDAYFARGGATGSLGWPTAQATCVGGGQECAQRFQTRMLVAEGSGASWTTSPTLHAGYTAGGGFATLGPATSDVVAYPVSVAGGGTAQVHAGGSVFASSAGSFAVSGAIRTYYFSLGGAGGRLGWPTGSASCTAQACTQTFQGSTITAPASGSATDSAATQIAAVAQAEGLGAATSPILFIAAATRGSGQSFEGGSVYASASGTFAVTGAIRDRYFRSAGALGTLGWPLGASVPEPGGQRSQPFTSGTIHTTAQGALLLPQIAQRAFAAAGGVAVLGAPETEALRIAATPSGYGVVAAIGSIYWRDGASTAFVVSGGIRAHYFLLGGATGSLGWPSSTMTCEASVCRQSFVGGTIVWDPANGARVEGPAFQAEIVALVNAQRASVGVAPVTAHPGLQSIAQTWSERMAANQTMVHSTTFCDETFALGFRRCAENVARTGSASAQSVMTAWMSSASHRATILNPNLTHLGVGVAQGANGSWYWTQDFGGR